MPDSCSVVAVPAAFGIDVVAGRSSITVRVVGEVDLATAGRVESALIAAVDAQPPVPVTVDIAGVSLLDAAGMTALVRAWGHAGERDVTIRLIDPQPLVRRVIDIVDLAPVFGLSAL